MAREASAESRRARLTLCPRASGTQETRITRLILVYSAMIPALSCHANARSPDYAKTI